MAPRLDLGPVQPRDGLTGAEPPRARPHKRRTRASQRCVASQATPHAIRRLADGETAKVVTGAEGGIDGFVIRAPWGGGATIARSADAALRIATARRRAAGPEGRVRVGLLDENVEGLARLTEVGLRLTWSAPRMLRGEPPSWRPDWIWGQFNHAMG